MGIRVCQIYRRRTFTGAWIETLVVSPFALSNYVAPSRVRGLKQVEWDVVNRSGSSRTFTGAWIETTGIVAIPVPGVVAPSRVRGLKPQYLSAFPY